MRKAAFVIVFIFFGLISFAQDTSSKSKIKLFDGSEFEVLIIENQPGKYIKIQLPGNEVARIDYDKIASIKHKSFNYRSH